METTGARLKKLRLEKGLSLDDVHKRTKVHLSILKAIEEDSLVNYSPTYINGFMKIYCKSLGLNPADFIPDYREPRSITGNRLAIEEKERGSFIQKPYLPPQPAGAGINPETLKSSSSRSPELFLKIKKPIIVILAFGLLLFGVVKTVKFAAWGVSLLFKKKKSAAVMVKKTNAPQKSVINKKPQGRPSANPKESVPKDIPAIEPLPVVSPISSISLVIRAKDNCWIKLKADGKIVFQNTLKKGRSESWQAKDRIEVSLSNAGAVDFEINGKLFSGLGRKNRVLKNILITKEGLRIPQ